MTLESDPCIQSRRKRFGRHCGLFPAPDLPEEDGPGERTLIMGIINVTPDSFRTAAGSISPERPSGGFGWRRKGRTFSTSVASPPAPDPIRSLHEERRRVIPDPGACQRIDLPFGRYDEGGHIPRGAGRKGAEIVNDVSAMRFDKGMAKVVADTGAAVVLMHMRGIEGDAAGDLTSGPCGAKLSIFKKRGSSEPRTKGSIRCRSWSIGHRFQQDGDGQLRLIRYLQEFKVLGRPILVGPSRKAFIGQVTEWNPGNGLKERRRWSRQRS